MSTSYISLNKVGETYSLTLKSRGPGGGPLFGLIGYGVTKLVCYSAAIGVGAAALKGTAVALSKLPNEVTFVGAMGTGIALTVPEIGLAAPAAAAAAAAATAAVATVESVSTAVGGALLLCPWLP